MNDRYQCCAMYETVDFFPLSAFPLRTILAPPILPRPLHAALWAKDEESAMVLLLDGGDDPNEVDGGSGGALHLEHRTGTTLRLS